MKDEIQYLLAGEKTIKFKEELEEMCNLSYGIEENAVAKGIIWVVKKKDCLPLSICCLIIYQKKRLNSIQTHLTKKFLIQKMNY